MINCYIPQASPTTTTGSGAPGVTKARPPSQWWTSPCVSRVDWINRRSPNCRVKCVVMTFSMNTSHLSASTVGWVLFIFHLSFITNNLVDSVMYSCLYRLFKYMSTNRLPLCLNLNLLIMPIWLYYAHALLLPFWNLISSLHKCVNVATPELNILWVSVSTIH